MSFKSYSFQARNYLLKNESQETYEFYKFFKSFRWIIKKGRTYFSLVVGSSPPTKEIENSQKGELWCPEKTAEPKRKKRLRFFPGPYAVKSHGFYLLLPSQTSLSFLQKASPPFSMWESCTWFAIVSEPDLQFYVDAKYAHHCWRGN